MKKERGCKSYQIQSNEYIKQKSALTFKKSKRTDPAIVASDVARALPAERMRIKSFHYKIVRRLLCLFFITNTY